MGAVGSRSEARQRVAVVVGFVTGDGRLAMIYIIANANRSQ
jgi:hypothetical protein